MTAASARAGPSTSTPRFTLESGEVLRDVRQAYVLEGTLNEAKDNVVLVFHSLTGSPETLGGLEGHRHRAGQSDRHDEVGRAVPEPAGLVLWHRIQETS